MHLVSTTPSHYFWYLNGVFNNSLTAKFILVGRKNSCSEGFGLAEQTAHTHPHHDGAVCLSSIMVFMAEHAPPLGASVEGVGQGHRQRV
jgi:hypothetical protein